MGASITLAGESLIAQKQGAGEKLEIARFVLALVPGLDPNAPVDRAAGKPPAAQIVFTKVYDRKGYVSPNQVIYSLMVGSDVGDWDFNWIGLEAAGGELLAVATVPVQQKRKNIPPLQIGNNVTRNFLVEFNGAQALTGITVDASTWQHDFTVRLNGIDLRERMSNRDVFGRVCFLADSLQMERSFGLYQLKAGIAYVEGIRIDLAEPVHAQLPALPAKAWLDVALAREGNETVATWKVVFGEAKADYVDSNGTAHYVVELASVAVSGEITDLRASEPINGALVKQYALRNGDYMHLRARGTKKEDVGLSELPNAKSDDPGTNNSEILATTKALKALYELIADEAVGEIFTVAMNTPPTRSLRANGDAVSRTVYAKLFAKIGTTYGAGNGVSTFNLPDARGLHPRFLDDGRGIDVDRVLGSYQADDIRSHNHTGSSASAGSHNHTASSDTQGAHTHNVHHGNLTPDGADFGTPGEPRNPLNGTDDPYLVTTTTESGAHAHNITINSGGDHSHAITITATGGTETRSKNIAFLACIRC
ncbi:phage tail protein [Pseudomonas fragi]|uniref:Phage tail protein n=1 Tax=Pseudomonas fragi TaxID=296 RepID=A0ABT4WVA4_PSEFR|nr:phage tail protein [Pseudomonas fragi]MDA7023996.1 phage tail protein [Pseudomonas fragi]